jgi:hypothetical protein
MSVNDSQSLCGGFVEKHNVLVLPIAQSLYQIRHRNVSIYVCRPIFALIKIRLHVSLVAYFIFSAFPLTQKPIFGIDRLSVEVSGSHTDIHTHPIGLL